MLVYSNFLVIFTLIGDIKAENNRDSFKTCNSPQVRRAARGTCTEPLDVVVVEGVKSEDRASGLRQAPNGQL